MKIISIYPSSISVISKKFNEENFYENKYLPVGNTKGKDNNVFRVLMIFDIKDRLPDACKIKTARLNLCVEKNIYTPCILDSNEVYLNYNTEEYNPLGVTWDNAPKFIYNKEKASMQGTKTKYFITLNIMDLVNEWIYDYKDNCGITLTGIEDKANFISIFSYCNNKNKPFIYLEVDDT
ncbi:DNRLRE domain-containing protein [Clostridium uliginosum]|uniref:Carbohydrate-binding module family 96 domain-containing protein n=1 Tax=Clostridium uliginosum TaxID=119641 RepID=A0A1I1HTZ0_9CLOT|nr:DNRLRE domain-containing protein [Clostridium uliginosum]SFC27366.1 hypothetical protein SAMN05421842_1025 [Clostridium uliginosum]